MLAQLFLMHPYFYKTYSNWDLIMSSISYVVQEPRQLGFVWFSCHGLNKQTTHCPSYLLHFIARASCPQSMKGRVRSLFISHLLWFTTCPISLNSWWKWACINTGLRHVSSSAGSGQQRCRTAKWRWPWTRQGSRLHCIQYRRALTMSSLTFVIKRGR